MGQECYSRGKLQARHLSTFTHTHAHARTHARAHDHQVVVDRVSPRPVEVGDFLFWLDSQDHL